MKTYHHPPPKIPMQAPPVEPNPPMQVHLRQPPTMGPTLFQNPPPVHMYMPFVPGMPPPQR